MRGRCVRRYRLERHFFFFRVRGLEGWRPSDSSIRPSMITSLGLTFLEQFPSDRFLCRTFRDGKQYIAMHSRIENPRYRSVHAAACGRANEEEDCPAILKFSFSLYFFFSLVLGAVNYSMDASPESNRPTMPLPKDSGCCAGCTINHRYNSLSRSVQCQDDRKRFPRLYFPGNAIAFQPGTFCPDAN